MIYYLCKNIDSLKSLELRATPVKVSICTKKVVRTGKAIGVILKEIKKSVGIAP
jgi:hypothetical protein